jgi:hypothetical protein
MLTCEIEETLSPEDAVQFASFTFFIYQVLRQKIKIEGLSEDQKDAYFLAALERSYRTSDKPYQRYHLFITFYKPMHQYSQKELATLATKLPDIFKKIDETLNNAYVENLIRYARKQLPSFLVLFSILKDKFKEINALLTDKAKLWNVVDMTCREKYQQLNTRIRNVAIRSFIYIFLTKMIFALILEIRFPAILQRSEHERGLPLTSIFPPILMLIIVSFFRVPGED